jgi:hypothetical protein
MFKCGLLLSKQQQASLFTHFYLPYIMQEYKKVQKLTLPYS